MKLMDNQAAMAMLGMKRRVIYTNWYEKPGRCREARNFGRRI